MSNCLNYFDFIIEGCITGSSESIILILLITIPICLVNIITKNHNKPCKKDNYKFKQLLKKYTGNNSKLFNIVDKLPTIYMHIVFYLLFLLSYIYLVWNIDGTVNSETTDSINNMSNVIYTIVLGTIGIIVICASLKKNYYVVFNYNDVAQKYKIRPVSVNLIIVLLLTAINQIILYTYNHIVCYVYIYPLITVTIVISAYLLFVTLNLLFSNTQTELTILNSLRFIYSGKKNISIENDNTIGTTTNIQYLCNKYIKHLSKLNRKCNHNLDSNFIYKYSSNKNIFNKKPFCNCLKTTTSTIIFFSVVLSIFTYFITFAKSENNALASFLILVSNFLSSICIFVFSLFLYIKINPTKRSTYNIIFGEKIHFIFYGSNKMYYFSDFPIPFPSYSSGLKWIHSLKNLDAFFKIYTNTDNQELQIERMKKIINTYKENLDIFFKNQIINPFIILPLILFFYHSYINFKDQQSVVNFYKEQKIIWNKELHNLAKSTIKDLYKNNTKFNYFLTDIVLK